MGKVHIYNVGTESVYQSGQAGRTECLAGVSQESLIREILTRHSCLRPVLTLHILVMCNAHASFRRMLNHELPAKTSLVFSCLSLHTLSLSNT